MVPMTGSVRPLGLLLSLLGNVLFALGLGGLIGRINDLGADALNLTTLLAAGRPLAMVAVGYVLLRFAPRFGGGSLGVQFAVIGVTSMLGAFHATDWTDRIVSLVIGGSFLAVSIFGLVAVALTYGWKHSLTHPSPVVLRRGAVAEPVNATNLAAALGAIANARTLAPAADPLTPAQRADVLARMKDLQDSGALTPEQVQAIQAWWDQPPESRSTEPTV